MDAAHNFTTTLHVRDAFGPAMLGSDRWGEEGRGGREGERERKRKERWRKMEMEKEKEKEKERKRMERERERERTNSRVTQDDSFV